MAEDGTSNVNAWHRHPVTGEMVEVSMTLKEAIELDLLRRSKK